MDYMAEIYLGEEKVFELPLEEEQLEELRPGDRDNAGRDPFNRFYGKVCDSETVSIDDINSYGIMESIYQEAPRILVNYLPPAEHSDFAAEIVEELGGMDNLDSGPGSLEKANKIVSGQIDLGTVTKKVDRESLLEDMNVGYIEV